MTTGCIFCFATAGTIYRPYTIGIIQVLQHRRLALSSLHHHRRCPPSLSHSSLFLRLENEKRLRRCAPSRNLPPRAHAVPSARERRGVPRRAAAPRGGAAVPGEGARCGGLRRGRVWRQAPARALAAAPAKAHAAPPTRKRLDAAPPQHNCLNILRMEVSVASFVRCSRSAATTPARFI
ncbi:hypothetical protein GQ55_9G262200 [Panicum hallii var. hallii]|uniref:Uncharacterized protein n=1 Tax=Panicum hallii var. hallii TaxID=1504633 RepID=A0A2T7C726_9POAL|nr:hypothetical protein GQ55_9G262200 [Panicum hallii var. hallii]PUZ39150.1 hypothetical protein GQ55_9G262200 [Panicum hallii var. hallii]